MCSGPALVLSPALGTVARSQVRTTAYRLPPMVLAVAGISADAEWQATLRTLDATWETDWPQTIALLDAFLARWPDYPAATDKLYAALIADADAQVQAGRVDPAVTDLERAARLRPEQADAWSRLAQLATSGGAGSE